MSIVMQHKSRSRKSQKQLSQKINESISTQHDTHSPDTSILQINQGSYQKLLRPESPISSQRSMFSDKNNSSNNILPSIKSKLNQKIVFGSQVNSSRNVGEKVLVKWDESPIKPNDQLLVQAEQQLKNKKRLNKVLRALPQSPSYGSSNNDEDAQSSDFSIELFDNNNQQQQQQNSIKRKRKLKKPQKVSVNTELANKIGQMFCNTQQQQENHSDQEEQQYERKQNIAQKLFGNNKSNNVSTPQPKTTKQLLKEINEIEAQKLKSSQNTIFTKLDERNEKVLRKNNISNSVLVLKTDPASTSDFPNQKINSVVVENLNLVALQRKRRQQKLPSNALSAQNSQRRLATEDADSRKNSVCSSSESNLDKIKGCLKPRNAGFSSQRKKSVFFDQKARLIDPKAGVIEQVDTKNSSQKNWKIQKTFYGKKLFNSKY